MGKPRSSLKTGKPNENARTTQDSFVLHELKLQLPLVVI